MDPNLNRVADSAAELGGGSSSCCLLCPPGKASGGQPLAEGEEQSAIEEPTSWPASQSSWEPVNIPGLEGCLLRTLNEAELENLPDDSSSSSTPDSYGRPNVDCWEAPGMCRWSQDPVALGVSSANKQAQVEAAMSYKRLRAFKHVRYWITQLQITKEARRLAKTDFDQYPPDNFVERAWSLGKFTAHNKYVKAARKVRETRWQLVRARAERWR